MRPSIFLPRRVVLQLLCTMSFLGQFLPFGRPQKWNVFPQWKPDTDRKLASRRNKFDVYGWEVHTLAATIRREKTTPLQILVPVQSCTNGMANPMLAKNSGSIR